MQENPELSQDMNITNQIAQVDEKLSILRESWMDSKPAKKAAWMAKIDAALAAGKVPPEQRAQIEDMRNQAVQLCGAGNEQEGLDVTAEAKALLGIE